MDFMRMKIFYSILIFIFMESESFSSLSSEVEWSETESEPGYLQKLREYDYRKDYDPHRSAAVIPEISTLEVLNEENFEIHETLINQMLFPLHKTSLHPLKKSIKELYSGTNIATKKQLVLEAAGNLVKMTPDSVSQDDLFTIAEIYHHASAFCFSSQLRRFYSFEASKTLERYEARLYKRQKTFTQKVQYCAQREMQLHMDMEVPQIHRTRSTKQNAQDFQNIQYQSKLMSIKFPNSSKLQRYYMDWSLANRDDEITDITKSPQNKKRKR